jgi:hypothetical protein
VERASHNLHFLGVSAFQTAVSKFDRLTSAAGLVHWRTMSAPFSRQLLRLASRFLLAALLFSQFALTVEACVGPRDMSRSLHQVAPVAEAAEAMPCHHHGGHKAAVQAKTDMPANLCVAHCTAGDQTSDTFQVFVHAAPALPILTLALLPDGITSAEDRQLDTPQPSSSPPIPILFGAFRS